MRRFHWTPEHTVFQPEFDAEHRELFRLGDDLQHALESGADTQQVEEKTRLLTTDFDAHMAHEERLMLAASYSGYEWHKRQHDAARTRLESLRTQPEELLAYLHGWLADHTGVADRMMAAALRNAGRTSEPPSS